MVSIAQQEAGPYTVEHDAVSGPCVKRGEHLVLWAANDEHANDICFELNAAYRSGFKAGRSAQVEETGPPDIDTFHASIREDMRKHIARYPNLSRKHYLDHAKALQFLTPSSVGEQTGDPAPTVEAIAAEIERWYLGLSDKPHQDGVLMLDRKANGYVLSDEERTRLRSRLTALYASPKGQGEGWTDQEIERIGRELYPLDNGLSSTKYLIRQRERSAAENTLRYARDRWKAGESGWIPVELAKRFHEAYERLAPSFGYATREDTRAFDPESANGKLMIAVCAELFPPKYTPSPDTQKP